MNYNQPKPPFKPQEEVKPLRYSKDSFTKELIGKTIILNLSNGKELQGRLIELGMYDVLIEISEKKEFATGLFKDMQKKIIVMKSAIVSVEIQ